MRSYQSVILDYPVDTKSLGGTSHAEAHVTKGQATHSLFVEYLCGALSIILIAITFPLSLCFCFRQVQEYERAVIFRLGRIKRGGAVGPGLFGIIPCLDSVVVTDLRTISFDVPPQEVLTKDSVTVNVDAVVYYRIMNPLAAVCNVANYSKSTKLLASTTLRTILGTKSLSEILSDRELIARDILSHLDAATDPWGIKVERVEVKDVRLPVQLQRAMAAEAEATREARAKVIAAEGEQKSSRSLKMASEILAESPSALQLRYLQTLTHISAEKNSTIVFPLPIDLISHWIPRPHSSKLKSNIRVGGNQSSPQDDPITFEALQS